MWVRTCVMVVVVVVVVVTARGGGRGKEGGGGGHTLDDIFKGQHQLGSTAEWIQPMPTSEHWKLMGDGNNGVGVGVSGGGKETAGGEAVMMVKERLTSTDDDNSRRRGTMAMVMRVGHDGDDGSGGGGERVVREMVERDLTSCFLVVVVLVEVAQTGSPSNTFLTHILREVGGVSQGVMVVEVEVEGGEVESWFSSPTNSPLLNHLREGGDPRFTCRAYILLMSHSEDHAARFLEETQVRAWPETRVVGVGPPSLVHPFLAHPALTNTAHALYLTTHTQDEPQTKDEFVDCRGHRFVVVSMDWFPFLSFQRHHQQDTDTVTPLDSLDYRMLQSVASTMNFTLSWS
ncbi:hypothetical protein Pmani_031956 [Petrolisthes manimaculis]|uniref:Uncharacterized protein n=1 Tax=Petrolisthes manimaculis TaxID=1843537 RepID=A0AAE1TRW6_9EUCA|nr:hypothetical protein Pmani_031956 [Petrolisthes manimaculis]